MKVIINADDLGISTHVNDQIESYLGHGILSSATIMANMPGTDQAIEIATKYPNISFGVHLNCTEGRPLSEIGRRLLTDERGYFDRNIVEAPSYFGKISEAVYCEWSEQITLLSCNGVSLSHVDSHHHLHTRPWLFFALLRVCKKYGIARVRNTLNVYKCGASVSKRLLLKKKLWTLSARSLGLKLPHNFASLDSFDDYQAGSQDQIVEFMVHPGHPQFEEEIRVLRALHKKEFSFDVVSYFDV